MKKLFLLLFLPMLLLAEMDFLYIRGLYSAIKKSDSYISPLHGFTWWKKHYIKHLYEFGDQNDSLVKFLHELFYLQHDQITFGPTILEKNPAKYFTASTIGKMVAALKKYEGKELDEANQAELKKELLTAIKADINFENLLSSAQVEVARFTGIIKPFQDQLSELDEELKKRNIRKNKLPSLIKRAKEEDKGGLHEELVQIESEIGQLKVEKNRIESNPIFEKTKKLLRQNNLDGASLNKLVDLLIQAYVENNSPDSHYVPYSLYQVLTAFLWAKAQSKNDFLDYFSPLKGSLKQPEILTPGKVQDKWLKSKFAKSDFESLKKELMASSKKERVKKLLENYEEVVFMALAYSAYETILPPIAQSVSSAYTFGSNDNQKLEFPNCGEVSLRNFFNIIQKEKGADRLDVTILKSLSSKAVGRFKVRLSPALIKFYESPEYTQVSKLELQSVHDTWNEVVSDLSDVIYLQPNVKNGRAEIKAGLENVLKVINHLVFGNNQKFDQLSSAEKLDVISKAISRSGWKLTWQVGESSSSEEYSSEDSDSEDSGDSEFQEGARGEIDKDTDILLTFYVNGKALFSYEFQKHHFVIRSLEVPEYAGFAAELANALKSTRLSILELNILAWLNTNQTLETVLSSLASAPDQLFLILNLNLSNKDQRVAILKELAAVYSDIESMDPKVSAFIARLIKSFWKEEDFEYANSIAKFIIKNKISPLNDLMIESAKKAQIKNPIFFVEDMVRPAIKYDNREMIKRLKPFLIDIKGPLRKIAAKRYEELYKPYFEDDLTSLPEEERKKTRDILIQSDQESDLGVILSILLKYQVPDELQGIVKNYMDQIQDQLAIRNTIARAVEWKEAQLLKKFGPLIERLKDPEAIGSLMQEVAQSGNRDIWNKLKFLLNDFETKILKTQQEQTGFKEKTEKEQMRDVHRKMLDIISTMISYDDNFPELLFPYFRKWFAALEAVDVISSLIGILYTTREEQAIQDLLSDQEIHRILEEKLTRVKRKIDTHLDEQWVTINGESITQKELINRFEKFFKGITVSKKSQKHVPLKEKEGESATKKVDSKPIGGTLNQLYEKLEKLKGQLE